MEVKTAGRQMLSGQIDEVLMMREQDHLGPRRQLREDLQCGGSAPIVELDQAVIKDERNRPVVIEVDFEAGQSQR